MFNKSIDIDISQDRMVITSPGSFLSNGRAEEYAIESIPSRRRNETICNILATCKLMERSGSGFEKIIEEYKLYSKKYQPTVKSYPDCFMITLMDLTCNQKYDDIIYPDYSNQSLDEKLQNLYKYIMLHPGLSRKALSYNLNVSENTLKGQIKRLVDRELVKRTGTRKLCGYIANSND